MEAGKVNRKLDPFHAPSCVIFADSQRCVVRPDATHPELVSFIRTSKKYALKTAYHLHKLRMNSMPPKYYLPSI